MNLIQIQLAAIERDQLEKFDSKRPIFSRRRRTTFTTRTNFDRPDREDTRERERDFTTPYDEPETQPPPEYPFHDFNYGP